MTEEDWRAIGNAVGCILAFAGILSLLLMILAITIAILDW
jgi:hypothetical protein